MALSERYAAQCDNCGKCTRDETRIGDEHNSPLCGSGGPGVFKEL